MQKMRLFLQHIHMKQIDLFLLQQKCSRNKSLTVRPYDLATNVPATFSKSRALVAKLLVAKHLVAKDLVVIFLVANVLLTKGVVSLFFVAKDLLL